MPFFTRSLGLLVLAIWLILTGLAAFIPEINLLGPVLPILAIVAGLLILIGR